MYCELTSEQKNDPYEMVKYSVLNNFDYFLERVSFENKIYSIKEAKAMASLFDVLKKEESDICLFLKSIKIKELESFNSIVTISLDKLNNFNSSNDYQINEQQTKNKTFESVDLKNNDLNPNTIISKAEHEIIDLLKSNQNIDNHSLFFDNIDKVQSVILCSAVFLKNKNIDSLEKLNSKKETFINFVLKNESFKQIEQKQDNREKEEVVLKQKKKQTLRQRPSLKKPQP